MKVLLAPLFCFAFTGCALISHGTEKTIQVTSNPSPARAVLICDEKSVGAVDTPGKITFKRRQDACEIRFTRDGLTTSIIALERSVSRAFWGDFGLAGGSFFGTLLALSNNLEGLIAFPVSLAVGGTSLIVDRLTGAMYEWSPTTVHGTLGSAGLTEVAPGVSAPPVKP